MTTASNTPTATHTTIGDKGCDPSAEGDADGLGKFEMAPEYD
jgi:hypothetical protein